MGNMLNVAKSLVG